MGERVAAAFKHAAVGSIVAVGVAKLGDTATRFLVQAAPASSGNDNVRGALIALGALGIGAVAMVAGDQLLTAVVGDDDPLFRLFYYQLAFHNMRSAGMFSRQINLLVSGYLDNGTMPAPAPVPAPAPDSQPAPTGCGASGCAGTR